MASGADVTLLEQTLTKQNGVVFVKPCIVHRGAYNGRNIVAKNSEPTDKDERGYFPVERWIVSKTEAQNNIKKKGEGLSLLLLHDADGKEKCVQFKDMVEQTKHLLGDYADRWPLTKILDIGGNPVQPRFLTQPNAEQEVPPIPAHVHKGNIVNGKAVGGGKKEAYFFPPMEVEPYKANFGKVITRLGFKPSISQEKFIELLCHFGEDDSMYELLQVYEIHAYDGWTIWPGVIHSPGPWLTFEIQLPQDDFNMCCWKLGCRIDDTTQREQTRKEFQLRGLQKDSDVLKEVIEWEMSADSKFKEKFYKPSKVLESGTWGRRLQLFFDGFYGEGFEIQPTQTWTRKADNRPYGGIIWSGSGTLNGNKVDVMDDHCKEFLVIPNTDVTIQAGSSPLLIYTVFPLE